MRTSLREGKRFETSVRRALHRDQQARKGLEVLIRQHTSGGIVMFSPHFGRGAGIGAGKADIEGCA